MGYGRGIDFLKRQREKYASQRGGVRKLWLTNDGDIGRFRFLTEGDQIFVHVFHEVKQVSGRGKAFTKDVLCKRRLDEEGEFADPPEACELCAQSVPGWSKGVAWVYLQWIAHRKKTDDKWVMRQNKDQVLYVEEVGEARLFLIKGKVMDQVQDTFHEKGTLTDRYYDMTRYGVTGEGPIQYVLSPKDPGEPDEACAAAAAGIKPLEEVVLAEFGAAASQAAPAAPSQGAAPAAPDPDEEFEF